MTTSSRSEAVPLSGLRVLVVDNDEELREQTVGLLRRWGCHAFAPEGSGDALVARAREDAIRHCCQLAVVDMRLDDNTNPYDISGLQLLQHLRPTLSIIISAFGNVRNTAAAFREYGAIDFVAKEDGPEALEQALQQAVIRYAIGARHTQIAWSDDLSSAVLRRHLFARKPNVPDDEADDLIGRLFHDAQRVVLATLIHDQRPSDLPLSSNLAINLRRETQIFLAQVDDQPALLVLKVGKREKIEREVDRYRRYVENGLRGLFRPEMKGFLTLWNMGVVIYRLVGNPEVGASDGPRTFSQFYRAESHPERILAPLQHFFEPDNWGNWYHTGVMQLRQPLFDAYDEMLRKKLSHHFPEWRHQNEMIEIPTLGRALPNPMRWLFDHYRQSNRVLSSRTAITHGDLHGDNLFASAFHAWPIDFERTGEGPILRDFVEIIQDILTRIAQFKVDDTLVVYDLAIALCAPQRPNQSMRPTARILAYPEAGKAFHVVQALQKIAADRVRYDDRREYLWGLLFNHVFVLSRIQPHVASPRYQHTLLMASVICERLNRWPREAPWPPEGWPEVQWVEQPQIEAAVTHVSGSNGSSTTAKSISTPRFSQGYALLIGVGGDLPNTVYDAQALAELLTDPQRCAYPLDQVTLLTGAQATRAAILNGLDRLAEVAQHDPTAVITVYFSGHGMLSPESFLLAHGYQVRSLATTAVAGAEFTARLRAINARRLLVLLDCCHAGGMAEVKGVGIQPMALPPELNVLEQGSGRVVIASSRRDEISFAGQPLSVFTQALREALAGYGASEADGYAYVTDVALYVGRKVPERTDGKQHPILKLAAADNFAISYYAGGQSVPKRLLDTMALPLIATPLFDLQEGYRQVLRKYQANLLRVELQMAEFVDQAGVPLDLARTRDGLLAQIARVEAQAYAPHAG
ncbi:MAG: response regulator [Oscillochloris sp.]|nr:response regulator [Oscillochloris sp.]